MESQPHNPDFRNNPENFHPYEYECLLIAYSVFNEFKFVSFVVVSCFGIFLFFIANSAKIKITTILKWFTA